MATGCWVCLPSPFLSQCYCVLCAALKFLLHTVRVLAVSQQLSGVTVSRKRCSLHKLSRPYTKIGRSFASYCIQLLHCPASFLIFHNYLLSPHMLTLKTELGWYIPVIPELSRARKQDPSSENQDVKGQ